MAHSIKYWDDLVTYRRRKTRAVYVGDVGIGGDHPIRVQSMTIADTMDTAATVDEVIQLVDVGCEIVRITAPSIKDAENLQNIKAELTRRGVTVPLVADIHYTPNAALIAADWVEKVRINPGNYADRKKFEQREYTDEEYERELARIEEKFKPLVLKCKVLGRAMRIGTNHGSLSDRIMNRFGDTPEGMVESALEFVRICQKYDYHDLVLSMKASNPQVAIQAYRLLAARMDALGMDYPIHLGVTEAGDGEEGRIKSAVGIGALLEEGIGDTVRVSLTEDSVAEVPVAFKLVEKYNRLYKEQKERPPREHIQLESLKLPDPFVYTARHTLPCDVVYHTLGADNVPRVELTLPAPLADRHTAVQSIRQMLNRTEPDVLRVVGQENGQGEGVCETVHVRATDERDLEALATLRSTLADEHLYVPLAAHLPAEPHMARRATQLADRLVVATSADAEVSALREIVRAAQRYGRPIEWKLTAGNETASEDFAAGIEGALHSILRACEAADSWNLLFSLAPELTADSVSRAYRYLAGRLDALDAPFPILLRYRSDAPFESVLLDASAQLGALFCDGIGDAVHIEAPAGVPELLRLSYNLLQASRVRISRTEFISCPSCGRTLFNLQTTTERIKSKTAHLKGVKIAIMGCIVNGPGEMADADFGYVGAGPRKVNLFVGKECVQRNIPEAIADERLIELIKSHGKWVDP